MMKKEKLIFTKTAQRSIKRSQTQQKKRNEAQRGVKRSKNSTMKSKEKKNT